jgi:hypothetical protein
MVNFFGNNPNPYIVNIESDFSGKLAKTYFLKTNHFVFNSRGKEIDVVFLSKKLEEIIEVGDSIIKYRNDNFCKVIKANGQVVECTFIYVPKGVRSNFRWPKKWRNKPKEWYGE